MARTMGLWRDVMEIFAVPMLGCDLWWRKKEELNIPSIGDGFKMKGTSNCSIICTPPKINSSNLKMMVWIRWFSFCRGVFSGSMLIFRGVVILYIYVYIHIIWLIRFGDISSRTRYPTGTLFGSAKKHVSTLRGFESRRFITLKVGFKSWLFLPFLLVLLKRDIGQILVFKFPI